jgi:hypothetical protein
MGMRSIARNLEAGINAGNSRAILRPIFVGVAHQTRP